MGVPLSLRDSFLASLCFFGLLAASPSAFADRIRILDNVFDAEKAHIEMIDRATVSLRAGYFIFEDDVIGGERLAAYRRAARRGVKVELILDAWAYSLDKDIVASLRKEGINVMLFHPHDETNLVTKLKTSKRFHPKYEVIDAEIPEKMEVLIEGRNVGDYYYAVAFKDASESFIDSTIWVKGDAARLCAIFHDEAKASEYIVKPKLPKGSSPTKGREWLDHFTRTLAAKKKKFASWKYEFEEVEVAARKIRFIADDIREKTRWAGVADAITEGVKGAQVRIRGETPYLAPAPELLDALGNKAAEGVVPDIVTNSRTSLDEEMIGLFINDNINSALDRDIRVRISRNPSQTLHTKRLVIDDTAYQLTANLNGRSHATDLEIGVSVADKTVAEQMLSKVVARPSIELKGRKLNSSASYRRRIKFFESHQTVKEKCQAFLKLFAGTFFREQF